MPARPSRNAPKNNKQAPVSRRQHQPQPSLQNRTSPPPTPPVQLPTPLPEEDARTRSGAMDQPQHLALDPGMGRGLGLAFGGDDNEGNTNDIITHDAADIGRLIDLDTPPPVPADEDGELDALDLEDSAATYRSPAFREAMLPEEASSPEPLPVPPRGMDYFDSLGAEEDGDDAMGLQGHRMEPTIGVNRSLSGSSAITSTSAHRRAASFSPGSSTSSPPSQSPLHSRYNSAASSSTFDNLSRTIRGYVPSSAPSPPSVSRPVVSVSRALFGGGEASQQVGGGYSVSHAGAGHDQVPSRRPVEPQEYEREYEREPMEEGAEYYGYAYGHGHTQSSRAPAPAPAVHAPQSRAQHTPYGQQQRQQQQHYGSPGPSSTPQHPQHQPQPQSPRAFPGSGLAQAFMRVGSASARVGQAQAVQATQQHYRSVSAGGVALGGRERQGEREGGQPDAITWARWDMVNERRILLLAYTSGLQIWDTGNLSSVSELLNLNFDTPEWDLMLDGGNGRQAGISVVHAGVLATKGEKDHFRAVRPLLGILMESADQDEREQEPRSTFVLYSLRTHQVVKLLPLSGLAHMFEANENFVIISTTTPPTLHILSSSTFHTLHTISSSSLEAFAPPLASHSSSSSIPSSAISITNAISATASTHIQATLSNKSVLLPGLSIDSNTTNTSNTGTGSGNNSPVDRRPAAPHAVFALSGRLLAFASPSPAHAASSPSLLEASSKALRRLSSSSTGSGPSHASSTSASSSPFGGLGLGKIAGMTQADVGHAALKVGESMFSGMRFLGGMALEAAKSRVAGPAAPEGRLGAYPRPLSHQEVGGAGGGIGSAGGGAGGRFVSRSAPDNTGVEEAAQVLRGRRYSNTASVAGWDAAQVGSVAAASISTTSLSSSPHHLTTVAPHTKPVLESGHYVTVLDLAPLLSGRKDAVPRRMDEFNASRSQGVVRLAFAGDGTSVAVVLKSGHAVRVFKLHAAPSVVLAAQASAASAVDHGAVAGAGGSGAEVGRRASQVYDLYRGRTTAIVENVDWTKDGRWLGIGTRNRTIHVFAVNPYGGKADIRSHLDGRVRNVEVTEPRLTSMAPLARLRGSKNTFADQSTAPLAFAFLSPSDLISSPELQFPFAPRSITHSPTLISPKNKRGTNYQDVLVFDPADGVLSLRRLTIEKRAARDQSLSGGVAASVHALGVTSISLPGMGGAGRLSSSPSKVSASTVGRVVEQPMELAARENIEATWNLKGGRDWEEIKRTVYPQPGASAVERRAITHGADWLAEGEISTCSTSTRVLPRSLYLSHQFSFHTLGEDYHALIRGYQFDVSGNVVEVRKAVEISAYSSGGGESSFVEGFSSPRDIRRASSSFDEPLASAISGSYDSSNLPSILPMYPNGIPGTKQSFRSSIPIRTMAGGVSEGIGRIRREMNKARSPPLVARSDSSLSGPVPLEFDEEDEDFLDRDTLGVPGHAEPSISRDTSRDNTSAESQSSLATPSNSITQHLMDADVVGSLEEEMWNGWDPQDKLAIEEAEQYDEIAAVGFVEDEPRYQPQPPPADAGSASKRKGRQKRR